MAEEKEEKQVTVVVKGCEIYAGTKKYAEGEEYACGEAEAARLVKAGHAVLKSGEAKAETPPEDTGDVPETTGKDTEQETPLQTGKPPKKSAAKETPLQSAKETEPDGVRVT